MLRQMVVSGLTIDPYTNSPIMILKDMEGEKTLPIWIGLLEATSIASELEKIKFSRPMTHDLFRNLLDSLQLTIDHIEVCDLKDNTFYALIYIQGKEKIWTLDARPSDAIAIALRTDAPILVDERVIQKSKHIDMGHKEALTSEEAKKWTDILENLSPEDFGKYKI